MPEYKGGVQHYNMAHELTSRYDAIDEIHKRIVGREAVITSARDGLHMKNSLHYQGKAIDLRTYDMKPGGAEAVVRELRVTLGRDFDVVLESDHIHLEYDPK
jgi:hypothetical protein